MKKFYITTSIAYTNAPPHIGFALELIQADLIARYKRQKGEEVFFLTGTDEHGLKIYQKARELGQEPKEFCDQIASSFERLTQELSISNDDFIRTTNQEKHWPGVEKLWNKISDDIYEKEYEGLYCVGCEAFIKEKDLVDGRCPYHKREPEQVKEKNHFFRLSRYSEQIREALETGQIEVIPDSRKNEMLSFIEKGLEDVSFSRPVEKINWGIPVPNNSDYLIYVWGDALANYLSAIGYGRESNFNNYWPVDVHFIGKDISKFHLLIWPGMLLSAGLELPKKVFIHGFLTVDGQKISKSIGNVVDPFDLIKEYGVDLVRYFFLREITPTEDGDFSREKLVERYNSDLASGLGNLVSRVISMEASQEDYLSSEVTEKIAETKRKRDEALDNFKFNVALDEIWHLISYADKYIERHKPWEKKDGDDKVVREMISLIISISEMIEPFMPQTAERILKILNREEKGPLFDRIK